MAIHRPSFSQKRPQQGEEKLRLKRSRPHRKKAAKKVEEAPKKNTSLRSFFLFGIIFMLLFGSDGSTLSSRSKGYLANRYLAQAEARTTVFGNVGLTDEQMRKVALNILSVANNMSDQYEVADGLTLTTYILRYFAEIGEYEIAYRDIMILVEAFEGLTNTAVGPEVREILDQTSKIRFGKKDGKYFAQFFAKNPLRGIVIPIEEVSEDPNSSLKEIKEVVIREGALLKFEDVDTHSEKERVREFIKKPIKLLGVIEALVDALNQVNLSMKAHIDEYLEDHTQTIPPLMIEMSGVSVEVITTTMFDDIIFEFNEAYAFPQFKNGEEPLPSFVLGAKAKLLNLKVSIDQ